MSYLALELAALEARPDSRDLVVCDSALHHSQFNPSREHCENRGCPTHYLC